VPQIVPRFPIDMTHIYGKTWYSLRHSLGMIKKLFDEPLSFLIIPTAIKLLHRDARI